MYSAPTLQAISPMKLQNHSIPNPGTGARHSRSGRGVDSDFINEDIDAEDVGANTLCGQLAAMDSAPTLKATSLMKL